jgi:hypothetical protein
MGDACFGEMCVIEPERAKESAVEIAAETVIAASDDDA